MVQLLVGRQGELGRFEELLLEAERGHGQVLVLVGEAGIGKSTLARALRERAAGRGFAAVGARAHRTDLPTPFGLVLDALGQRIGDLMDGDPAHLGALWVQDSVLDAYESLAADSPVLVVLDDIQWADAGSLNVLAALVRRAAQYRMLVCAIVRAGARPFDVQHVLDVAAEVDAVVLEVEPLAAAEVEDLARRLAGSVPPDTRRRLAGAGGNPLLVTALVASGSEAGRALERLVPSGGIARELVDWLAVIGEPADAELLAALAGTDERTVLREIGALLSAGVLVGEGGGIDVAHDLLREFAVGSLSEPIRAAMHRRVGRELIARHGSAHTIADHLSAASAGVSLEAAEWLLASARTIATVAPESAVRSMRRGMELAPPGHAIRTELQRELAHALLAAGDTAGAIEAASAVLEGATPAERTGLFALIADAHLAQGDPLGSLRWIETAESAAGSEHADGALVTRRAHALLWSFDLERAAATADELIVSDAADPLARASAVSAGWQVRSRLACLQGDLRVGAMHARRGLDAALASPGPERADAHHFCALALVNLDRFDDALQHLHEGRSALGKQRRPVVELSYLSTEAMLAWYAGRWDDAVAISDAGFSVLRDTGSRRGAVSLHAVSGLVAVRRGAVDEAADHLARGHADASAPGGEASGLPYLQWLALALDEAKGVVTEPAAMNGLVDLATVLAPAVLVWFADEIVSMWVANGETDRISALVGLLDQIAGKAPTPTTLGVAGLCRAQAFSDAAGLVAAAELLATGGRPLLAARAHERAASAVETTGDTALAVTLLGEANERYRQLGASLDERRTAAGLRRLGVARGSTAAHAPARDGFESLTAAERAVGELLVTGAINAAIATQLFISKRTVESHVSRMYQKLQVSTRVELAAALRAHYAW